MEHRKKRIKALIFDVGGVLRLGHPSFDHPEVHHFVSDKLKIDLDRYLDAIDTAYTDSIVGKISEKKALEIMARNLETIKPKKLGRLYIKAYKKYYVLNKELINYVKNYGGMVGTMDKELKKEIKKNGGSIISF